MSRAAGARGAAFKVKVNLGAVAAPSGADSYRHTIAAPETEKAEVLSVADCHAGTVAAGCLAGREGPAALSNDSKHGIAEFSVEAGSPGTASAAPSAAPNTGEGSNPGAVEAARDQHSKAERRAPHSSRQRADQ